MATIYSLRDLGIAPGRGKHEDIELELAPYTRAGQEDFVAKPATVPATLDISAMVEGNSFHLRFSADYHGACARCLEPALFHVDIDNFEVHDPDSDADDLQSEYVDDTKNELDLTAWALGSVALEFPTRVLCKPDCLGLCPVCGANQNESGLHEHEQPTDSRWDALKGVSFDEGE